MPLLYFVRHGETDWNREGRLQGRTEIPINTRGEEQARMVARHLEAIVPRAPDGSHLAALPFIASPMIRTRQTVEIIRRSLGLDPQAYTTDARLRELSFGRWEGKTWREVHEVDPEGARERERNKWDYVPPGGENYAMVATRVGAWLENLTGDCCVVAHGGVARALLVLAGGASRHEGVNSDIWQGRLLLVGNASARWFPEGGDG